MRQADFLQPMSFKLYYSSIMLKFLAEVIRFLTFLIKSISTLRYLHVQCLKYFAQTYFLLFRSRFLT